MRRLVVAVLACGLLVSSTMGSSLHVHVYADHDHPEHHHGPAMHDHGHSTIVDRDHHPITDGPAIEAESCGAGRHVVSVTMSCAYVPQVHIELAELPGPISDAPSSIIRFAIPVTDVRVHGPPFDARIPSRAPPVVPHA